MRKREYSLKLNSPILKIESDIRMFKYDYVLKRSASRKSIGICVKSDNTIIVRCPQRTKPEQIDKFLAEKQSWVEKHLRRNERTNARFLPVISGKSLLVKGEMIPFYIDKNEEFSEIRICLSSVTKLKKVYIDNLGDEFTALVDKLCSHCALAYKKVSFRDYKSRWGCCSSGKELTFNYKLLMLPPSIWVYVIVHELCHTLYMNHSAAFWKCVEKILPDYKTISVELKQYSFLCSMY